MALQERKIVLSLHSLSQYWFLGRVVRRRSAKPSTAVRIRQEPLSTPKGDSIFTVTLLYYIDFQAINEPMCK